MSALPETASPSLLRTMLNNVPEATIFNWVIKILATTVGETISDWFALGAAAGDLLAEDYIRSFWKAVFIVGRCER